MNTLLWALQIALALKFVSIVYSHGISSGSEEMRRGIRRLGPVSRHIMLTASIVSGLGSLGLVLPLLGSQWASYTPWAAAALALLMLPAIGLHFGCRDKPLPIVGIILLAMAAFVAYGRSTLAPLP